MSNTVATLSANLRLDISDFSAKMAEAGKRMGAFAKQLNKDYGKANAALKSHNISLRDTTRIIQGIMVSQAFYTGARSIREATRSLMEFNEQLDYANVTYSALFGDTKLAQNFVSVLQEHAVNTIFEYSDLADSAKKLLAYGIEYKNLMFIMEGLTNLGAMSGDTAALDRIALALGQIQTTGYLAATEMRQLANAYVPIYDIIQDSFGLTGEQMKNVGALKLPAHEVINSIVDYANARFGTVGDAAMFTITGLKNRVVDTMKVMGSEMMAPLTMAWKSFLAYAAGGLETIRSLYREGGWGNIFEHLVPDPHMQMLIRDFVANVRNMLMSLASVGVVLGQVFGNFIQVFMTAFNILSPIIVGVTNALASVANAMLQTEAGAYALRLALVAAAGALVVLRVQTILATVVTFLTSAIMGLSKALMILAAVTVKHPIFVAAAAIATALIGVANAANIASAAILRFFSIISGLVGGMSGEDVFQKVENNVAGGSGAINDFNNRLEDSIGGADDLADSVGGVGDAAKKAEKEARGLLSFDEVFKLPEPADTSGAGAGFGAGALAGLGDLIDGLGALGDALIPDIPDFTEYIKAFTDGLFGGLADSWVAKLMTSGLGYWLAKKLLESIMKIPVTDVNRMAVELAKMIAKGLMGAFVGLGFDALASLITDKLWEALEEAFGLMDGAAEQASLGATIGSVIGGAIGYIVGGLPGSLIGSAIGHLAGGIVGLTWKEIGLALSNTFVAGAAGIATVLAKAFGASFKEVVKLIDWRSLPSIFSGIGTMFKEVGLKSIAKGGALGLAIGFVTDAIAALLWNSLAEKFELSGKAEGNAKIGQTIGSILGAIIGGILGGPAGALIGSAIGTFAAGFVGLFWEKIAEYFDPENNVLSKFVVDMAVRLSEWWIATKDGFIGWATDTWDGLSTWFTNTTTGFNIWWTDTFTKLDGWWTNTKTGFVTWFTDTFSGLTQWWNDTVAIFSDWDTITGETLINWWTTTKEGFILWANDTALALATWLADTLGGINGWITDTLASFLTWKINAETAVLEWCTATKEAFLAWVREIFEAFFKWCFDVLEELKKWRDDTIKLFKKWIEDTIKQFTDWIEDVIKIFLDWVRSSVNAFNEFRNDVLAVITGFVLAALQAIAQWCTDVINTFVNWGSNIVTTVQNAFNNAKTAIQGFFTVEGLFSAFCNNVLGIISSWGINLVNAIASAVSQAVARVQELLSLAAQANSIISGIQSAVSFAKDLVGKAKDAASDAINYIKSVKAANDSAPSSVKGALSGALAGVLGGHASGGIFDREHIARFAEGNKAEAIIPLEESRAMQPFVDAVANGLVGNLAPIIASGNGGNASQLPPMYVGTLIADERGLKELYKRFELIKLQEDARRGVVV